MFYLDFNILSVTNECCDISFISIPLLFNFRGIAAKVVSPLIVLYVILAITLEAISLANLSVSGSMASSVLHHLSRNDLLDLIMHLNSIRGN